VPVTMYTTQWCGFCRRLKGQLARVGVEVAEVDIERDEVAAQFVMSVNGGNQTVPTLLFSDGSTMVNPTAAQVQARLTELTAAPLSVPNGNIYVRNGHKRRRPVTGSPQPGRTA
jgi:mycoredoxin